MDDEEEGASVHQLLDQRKEQGLPSQRPQQTQVDCGSEWAWSGTAKDGTDDPHPCS